MKYKNMRVISVTARTIGFFMAALSLISTLVSLVKGLVYAARQPPLANSGISQVVEKLYSGTYYYTQFLDPFWKYSPVPYLKDVFSPNNIYLMSVYFLFFLGAVCWAYGAQLKRAAQRIDRIINDEHVRMSVVQQYNSGSGDRGNINVSIFPAGESFSRIFFVPLAVAALGAVLGALILQYLGHLGFV